jgi:fructose-bisphosphate aldolase class I
MSAQTLEAAAQAMVADGKGILAIDESSPTIKKRFDAIKTECTEENRRAYRELLITCAGLEEFISGMILFDETIRQSTSEGVPFPELMKKKGIMPGIKVDKGAKDLAWHPGEKVTEGLDGLRLDGNHSIERCFEVTEVTLRALFSSLHQQRVLLEGTILKASMVLSGNNAPSRAGVEAVAEQTIACLKRSVPAALPGVVFLSGGQTPKEATAHLNAMNAMAGDLPWKLSFSYSRALQEPALNTWAGSASNGKSAQDALYHRARLNSAASLGKYSDAMEKAAA